MTKLIECLDDFEVRSSLGGKDPGLPVLGDGIPKSVELPSVTLAQLPESEILPCQQHGLEHNKPCSSSSLHVIFPRVRHQCDEEATSNKTQCQGLFFGKMRETLAERLLKLRTAKGLSQVQMAQKMAVNIKGYQRYEKGENVPGSEKIMLLAEDINDLNLNWLLTGEGPMIQGDSSVETEEGNIDPISEKILSLLRGMDEESRRDVLKYVEKEKRFIDIERKLNEVLEGKQANVS